MASTFCTPLLEIEFDAGVWTDVTAYLIEGGTERGRRTSLDRYDAGTATFRLTNLQRQFDPLHTSGTYYGDILPGKRIRFTATYNALTYDVFFGYIDEWDQTYEGPRAAYVDLRCSDALSRLASIRLPDSIYATFVEAGSPFAWWRLGETSGRIIHDIAGGGYHGVYANQSTTERAVPAMIVGTTEATCIDFDGVSAFGTLPKRGALTSFPWSLECWFRTATTTLSGPGIYWCSDGTNIIDVYLAESGAVRSRLTTVDGTVLLVSTTDRKVVDGKSHHLAVTYADATSAPTIWIDGQPSPSSTASATGTGVLPSANAFIGVSKTTGLKWVGQLSDIALYNDEFSDLSASVHYAAGIAPYDGQDTGARVSSILDLAGWSPTDRTIDTGISTLGPANYDSTNVLAYLQDIEATERGRLYADAAGKIVFKSRHSLLLDTVSNTSQATFVDDLTSNRYAGIEFVAGTDLVYNTVGVSALGGVEQTVADSSSVTTYGEQTLSLGELLWRTPQEARAIAEWELARYKDASPRATRMVLYPRRAPTNGWLHCLGRKIGDRITVKRTPQGVGSQISLAQYIEGVRHSFNCVEQSWVTEWSCSTTIPGTWFVWGTSNWGGSGGWAA